jgi:PAS domain S-box-containing protein
MSKVIPGGFFIYHEDEKRELIYANDKVCEIYGCANLDEFKELTGYTFQGMVHPDDFQRIQDAIDEQIDADEGDSLDQVEYRIIRKDGEIRWVDDYGHFSHSPEYGDIYYVFISDITEKRRLADEEREMKDVLGMLRKFLSDTGDQKEELSEESRKDLDELIQEMSKLREE